MSSKIESSNTDFKKSAPAPTKTSTSFKQGQLSSLQKQISMHRRTAQSLQDSLQVHITYTTANLCTSDVTALRQSLNTVASVRLTLQGMLLILILNNVDIIQKES